MFLMCKDIEYTKKLIKYLKMKTTMCEMKNQMKVINGRLHFGEERIIGLENITIGTVQKDTQKK